MVGGSVSAKPPPMPYAMPGVCGKKKGVNMFTMSLLCLQGECFATDTGACTDIINARTFHGCTDAILWLFNNRSFLEAIGCTHFQLSTVITRLDAEA